MELKLKLRLSRNGGERSTLGLDGDQGTGV